MTSQTSTLPADDASKPWWASQGIWGGITTIGASLTGAYLAWKAGDLNAMGACLTAAFGGVQAIIGRVRAEKTIGKVVARS